MPQATPVAVLFSDLHLTLAQPACRADKDWMGIQAHYLKQVKDFRTSLNPLAEIPIVCAGDIFDRWNPPPELINFALDHLPDNLLCVPGQHDLPYHRIDLMHRSGYGVLKKAGKIIDLSDKDNQGIDLGGDWVAYGFGWEQPIRPPAQEKDVSPEIESRLAVVHRYIWTGENKHPNAQAADNVAGLKKALSEYAAAVFGDNHKGFLSQAGHCVVLNPGGFIRRKSDEIDYQPGIGVLYSDGTIRRKKLDVSGDLFHEADKGRPEMEFDMKGFIEGLEGLGEHGLDFKEALLTHIKKESVHQRTKEIILKALG